MDTRDDQGTDYVVPTYEAPRGAAFYHFLHGNVPGHEIDFIYRPTMSDGPLSRQHFGHLSRLLMFIEPRGVGGSAFAIGNLSRDDSHHEPGHGGLAFILGLRIRGARDHAGRPAPSFSHALAAIDRDFDAGSLLAAALVFQERVFAGARPSDEEGGFYHAYARCGEDPARALELVEGYTREFGDLRLPGPSRRGLCYSAGSATQPRRIVIVHGDGAAFEEIARIAARVAAVLYRSDVKWTAISNGRESDLPGGVTVRLLPASEAGVQEEGVAVHRLEELPEAEEALASRLFQASPTRKPGAPDARPDFREIEVEVEVEEPEEKTRTWEAGPARKEVAAAKGDASRARVWMAAAAVGMVALVGIGVAVMRGETVEVVEPTVEPPAVVTVVPTVVQTGAMRQAAEEKRERPLSEAATAANVKGGAVEAPVKAAGAVRRGPRQTSVPRSQSGSRTTTKKDASGGTVEKPSRIDIEAPLPPPASGP